MTSLYDYALTFCGLPYRWGGTDPMEGYDCSGLVRQLLHSQGIHVDSPGNAQGLYAEFSHLPPQVVPSLGALVFYGKSTEDIYHVAMALNEYQHIEAAGGDHSSTSLARAIEQNAFVRLTPIREQDRIGIYLPQYPFRQSP